LLADKNENNIKFNTYKAQDYHQLLNKIRNASRYVYNKYISEKVLMFELLIKIN